MIGRPSNPAAFLGVTVVALAAGAAIYWLTPSGPSDTEQWSLVEAYCLDCHNGIDLSGDISF